jgi:hypothetical protein
MNTEPSSRATTACPGIPMYGSSDAGFPNGSITSKRSVVSRPVTSGSEARIHRMVELSASLAPAALAAPIYHESSGSSRGSGERAAVAAPSGICTEATSVRSNPLSCTTSP